ncbi:MAG: Ribonuclease protein component [Planctomycetota bacterium]
MPTPPRLRFARHMRMSSGKDFDRAFRLGGRAKGKLVSVVAAANGGEHTRLGLSVGRACWKGAVQRNRVRRVFREAFRLSYADLPKGCDLVLMPAAPRLAPTLAAVQAELGALAKKAWAKRKAQDAAPGARAGASGGAAGP